MHARIDLHIQDYLECGISRGLHCIDARVKLVLLVGVAAVNIYFAKLWLSVALFCLGTSLAIWSHIPPRLFVLFFLIPAWSTLLVTAGFAAGFGTTPFYSVGPVTFYHEGLKMGLAAAARVACDIAWIAAVFLTTPFNALLQALKWFRIPAVFLDTIAMGYRYVSLIMEEFTKMRNSARTRGGFLNYRLSLQSTSRILAQILLRAYDRAMSIQESMICRGAYSQQTPDKNQDDNGGTPGEDSVTCPNQCNVTPEYSNLNVPVLECVSLSHTYDDNMPTLHDVSFAIHKHEIVVLCGPNGAGKTTLLKLLSGILFPTGGEIYHEGELLQKNNKNSLFRHVGFLCQDPNDQLFCTHVREDVCFGPTNLQLPEEEVNQLADTAMELMEVADLADRPIHRLSYGQMKRVGLAGLIAMKPPLLLLDEPWANLDPAATGQLIKHLRHLNRFHGYSFIIVTHDMNQAARIADRILILDHGKIKADGTAREILTNEALLRESRLEPPLLTRMFKELLKNSPEPGEIPLTLDDAVSYLRTHSFRPDGEKCDDTSEDKGKIS